MERRLLPLDSSLSYLHVRGRSGRLYEVTGHWVYLLDGFGARVMRTCWSTKYEGDEVHPVDQLWSIALALQHEEERVWSDKFFWVALSMKSG